MKNIVFLSITIGLTTLGLATAYALNGLWGWVSAVIALGLLWLGGQWRGWHQVTALAPLFFIGLIALGMLQDLAVGWLLFSIVAVLVAWDLRYFVGRLQQTRLEDAARLQRIHLQRLLIVAGLGLFLASIALNLQFELNLGWGIFLGAVVIVGLSQVVGRVRQESD
jgi:hypothetical protein